MDRKQFLAKINTFSKSDVYIIDQLVHDNVYEKMPRVL